MWRSRERHMSETRPNKGLPGSWSSWVKSAFEPAVATARNVVHWLRYVATRRQLVPTFFLREITRLEHRAG